MIIISSPSSSSYNPLKSKSKLSDFRCGLPKDACASIFAFLSVHGKYLDMTGDVNERRQPPRYPLSAIRYPK